MSIQFIAWNIGFLFLCICAGLAFPKSWKVKLSVIIISTAYCALIFFGSQYIFSLTLIYIYPWLIAIVSVIFIIWGLLLRKGRWRIVGFVVGVVALFAYGYPAAAWNLAHSISPVAAAFHLPTFYKAQSAVKGVLNDPDSAQFKGLNIAFNEGHEYVCGEVNARNRMGGLVGFTPFYVQVDEFFPEAYIVDMSKLESYNNYSIACYGPDSVGASMIPSDRKWTTTV